MCELRERERGVRGETGKRYRDERRNEKCVGREVKRRRREERWGGVRNEGMEGGEMGGSEDEREERWSGSEDERKERQGRREE